MPAKSPSQFRLMQAAKHGATFPKAKAIRQSMTRSQLDDFTDVDPARFEGESHSYNSKSRNNLRQNRGR
jgi:hypothetical protein